MNENTNITNTCESIKSCDECGQCDVELFEVDGRLMCEDCLERLGYVRCQHCGEWFLEDEGGIYDGDYICGDCITNLGLKQCDECGEYHKSRDMVTVYGGWRYSDLNLCENCLEAKLESEDVFHCDDCGDYFLSRAYDSYTTASGDTICERCRNDHYAYCSSCDELYHEDDMHWSEDSEEYLCDSCYEEQRCGRYGRKINQYSFKPDPIFHGKFEHLKYGRPSFGDPLTFGFELEVDKGSNRNDCAGELDEAFGGDTLYMKEDGSVDFEIVTHPHTLQAYRDELDFEKLCRIPRDYDYKSHDAGTCGFHIHVGRAQLAATATDERRVISHIILLMYRHWASLVKFSRRNEGQLSRWAKAPRLNFFSDTEYSASDMYDFIREEYMENYDRYLALNLQNRGTIEFRLWRGSLKPETLKATIQLTSNIVRYAMDHTMYDVAKSTFDDIVQYETCPELLSYVSGLDLSACTPKDIPLSSGETKVKEPTCGFKVGDRVRIMRSNSLVSARMVGAFGTVRFIRKNFGTRKWDIAVQIDMSDPVKAEIYRGDTHWCEGHCPDYDGYWVNPETIAHVRKATDDFAVGDVLDLRGTPVLNWLACEEEKDEVSLFPEVLRIKGNDMIGLYFAFYRHGHDLDMGMNFPAGYHTRSGWWFSRDMLHAITEGQRIEDFAGEI